MKSIEDFALDHTSSPSPERSSEGVITLGSIVTVKYLSGSLATKRLIVSEAVYATAEGLPLGVDGAVTTNSAIGKAIMGKTVDGQELGIAHKNLRIKILDIENGNRTNGAG